jgi:Asp-tRNA(Asn)/Glu-tRNA(Gln) amidotransferase A subunit family amidase
MGGDAGATPGQVMRTLWQRGLLSRDQFSRRGFFKFLSAVSPALFGPAKALATPTQSPPSILPSTIAAAEKVVGLEFTETERALMTDGIVENLKRYDDIRALTLPWQTPPAFRFDVDVPGVRVALSEPASGVRLPSSSSPLPRPASFESLAFSSLATLSEMVRTRRVSSLELTTMYLDRIKKHDSSLLSVITVCEELALAQARRADRELATGIYRGPLHGIPWGAKDVLAVKEYPTTWGAAPYQNQVIPEDATVVQRLEAAGAVIIAKLSLGETARGRDGALWFGGMTRNPWNLEQPANGSSAGSASATAAGLVGFSIGGDTRGSIILPCNRCGASGLRPTFGTVSRHGAMVLAWTMDRLGPICRTAADCAAVFDAIRGSDGHDASARDVPFGWDANRSPAGIRVGYLRAEFERDYPGRAADDAALRVLREMVIDLVPVEVPSFPHDALRLIMDAETGASFDELTRSNQDDLLADQEKGARPNNLRHSRFIPAVEYIQACRARTLLMRQMAVAMEGVDVVVAPSLGETVLRVTSLTGHPGVVVPNGFSDRGTPFSITFLGGLFKDSHALTVAHAYQKVTDYHLRHPVRFGG